MPADTRWLTTEESAAWVRLVALAELLPSALDAQLAADVGLTHFEYVTLMVLADAPERTMRMTALASLTNATLPYIRQIARRGWKDALRADAALAGGLNIVDGRVVNAGVATAHGLELATLESALA